MLPRRFEVQYAPLTDTSLKTSMDPVHGRMKACHFGLEATGFKVTPIAAAAQLFTGPSDTLMAEYYSSKIRGSKPLSFVSCPRSRDIIVTYIATEGAPARKFKVVFEHAGLAETCIAHLKYMGFSHHTADTLAANSSLLRADPSVRPLAAVSLPMQSLPPSLPIAKRSRPEEAEWPSQGFRLDDEDPVGDEAARVAMLRGVVPPRPSELSYNSYQMPYPAAMQYQPTPSFSAVPPAPLRPQPRPSVPPRTQTPAPAPKPAKSKPKAATTGTTAAAPAKQAPVKAPAPAVTKGGPSVRPTAPVNPFGVPTEFGTFIDVPDATIKCYISHLMFDPAFADFVVRVGGLLGNGMSQLQKTMSLTGTAAPVAPAAAPAVPIIPPPHTTTISGLEQHQPYTAEQPGHVVCEPTPPILPSRASSADDVDTASGSMLMPTSSPNDANTQQDALLDPFGAAVTVRGEDADTQPIEAFPDDERMSPAVL